MTIIKDGVGKGFSAKVNKENRLTVQAVSESESLHAMESGLAYNVNTGLISITGDATLAYLKNTNTTKDLVIDAIIVGSFEGITHSDDPYITAVRNPTAGDLITDATTTGVINQNRNFSSNNSLEGVFYKGKVGGTLTGGNNLAIFQINPAQRNVFTSINLTLGTGNSLGITLTANRSSGTANYYLAFACHFLDVDLS
jgi:hypothetical protein